MAATECEVRAPRAGVRILLQPAVRGFRDEFLDAQYWRERQRARPVGAGRGANWFVDSDAGPWVLRHYRRGGLVARLFGDRYLWTGYKRSRSFREFRLLAALHERGLPVPRPVAARVIRRGLIYRADLITEMLPGTATLAARLVQQSLGDDDLAAAGRLIRQLHELQVWHADLNAHNILLDGSGQVYLIDFDRACRRSGERWKADNLARLRRSLDKLTTSAARFDDARWQRLRAGYRDAPVAAASR